VEKLDGAKRTTLFRVTQEALTNVARHAKASQVEIHIQKQANGLSLSIHDNGRSFQVQKVLLAKGSKRLGLLGMRERVEMVGGQFEIKSARGEGTTIHLQIPSIKKRGGGEIN
jgi:signal transduction histidine kinase